MADSKTRRTKGDGLIRERKDGWEGRIPIGKNPVTGRTDYKYFYGKTMAQVREKMRIYENDPDEIAMVNGIYKKVETTREQTPLFSDWLDTWLTQYKANSITPSTYESYQGFIEQHIKPALGNILIGEITADQIQQLLNNKQKVGARKDGRTGALSTSSVMKIKIIINASLKQAVKNHLISSNPTEAVTPPKMTRREIRVLTPEEQDKFMNALKGHRLEALFKLALATGMRKGELLALTWEKVDFEDNTISISKTAKRVRNQETMKSSIEVGGPKSKSGYREIPMLPSVAPILSKHYILQQKEQKEAGSAYNQLGIVFCSKVGTYIEARRINSTLEKILKQAGVEHINFHALRHTFATRALENSVPAKVVQKMLGHADVSLTLNTYTHVLKETLHDEIGKMDNIFIEGAVKAREKSKGRKELDTAR